MCGISIIFIAIIVIVLKRNKLARFFVRTRCGPILKCTDAELGKQTESTPLDVVPLEIGDRCICTILNTVEWQQITQSLRHFLKGPTNQDKNTGEDGD